MRTIAEMMRARDSAIKREARIAELAVQWETGEYITASEAAEDLHMSPMRFFALLRKERDKLPIEKNELAMTRTDAFMIGTIEQVFYERGINPNPNFIKLHRYDWDIYVASLATITGQEPTATETEAEATGEQKKHVPRDLWEQKSLQQVCNDMRVAGFEDDTIAYALFHWRGIKNMTKIGTLLRGDGMTSSGREKHARKVLKKAGDRYYTD